MLDKVRAGVLIVRLNRLKKGFERDVVIDQRLLIDDDLILLDVSAKAKHVGDTGHRSQLQLDNPVLNCAQFLIALAAADDLVKIDLAGSGGDGAHRGFKPCRDVTLCVRKALEDLLAGEVDVRVVPEIDHHHRQTELGDRFHPRHARNPVHLILYGKSYELLDLLWRQSL